MDLTLNEDEQAVRQMARQVLADRAPAESISAVLATPDGYNQDLYTELAEMGWMSLGLIDDDDASITSLGLVITQLGYVACPGPYLSSMIAGLTLRRLGSSKARVALDRIVAGEVATVVDATHLPVIDQRLSGALSSVEWLPVADVTVLAARDGDGIALWLLDDERRAGVSIEAHRTIDGAQAGSIVFDDVRMGDPIARVSHRVWRENVHLTRLLRAANLLGVGQRVLQMAVEHVLQREQFGKLLGQFQAVQHHLANIAIDVEAAENLIHYALWRYDAGLAFEREAAEAAWHTAEQVAIATQNANQVHGGISFMKEFHLHHFHHRSAAERARMGSLQARSRELGDVVFEAMERGFATEFEAWPIAPQPSEQ